jgi:phage major head subunit gpT-like protein
MEVGSLAPGFLTRIETREYALQLIAERKLIDDEQYGVLEDRASKLMKSAMRTMSKIEIEFLTEAFSSAFSTQRKEEGVALCSSSHTTKSGASTTVGFNNVGTAALSKSSLATARLAMRQFRNDIGERMDTGTNFAIVIPSALADTADEIINTAVGYNTAAGDKNVAYQRYKIIEVPLLDDYDSNNWYMVDLNRMKDNLIFWDRISPEPHNTVDWNTFQLLQAIYFRCGWGWKGWRWIYGNQVS